MRKPHKLQHRRMFNGSGDRVPISSDTDQRQVVRLGSAAGENDLFRRRPQQRRYLTPRLIQFLPGRLAEIMDTGSVAVHFGHRRQHGFQNVG